MTQEQKAKAYDEALEIAKDMINRLEKGENILLKADLKLMFPQLKESEDERIRKELIEFVKSRGGFKQEYIAWLEKQGERKVTYTAIVETGNGGINALVQGELSADKIEPKFKVGDWVTNSIETVQITGYDIDYGYQVDYKGNLQHRDTDIIEKEYHPWTIEDAKDGDVLIDEDNNIGIYKEIEGVDWNSYIYLGCDNHLYGFSIGGSHVQNNTKPATKEQRDLLFQKMKEKGYEWDAEKKELKKIEQKPAWSEEDEKTLTEVIDAVQKLRNPYYYNAYDKSLNWLKSLKERIGG